MWVEPSGRGARHLETSRAARRKQSNVSGCRQRSASPHGGCVASLCGCGARSHGRGAPAPPRMHTRTAGTSRVRGSSYACSRSTSSWSAARQTTPPLALPCPWHAPRRAGRWHRAPRRRLTPLLGRQTTQPPRACRRPPLFRHGPRRRARLRLRTSRGGGWLRQGAEGLLERPTRCPVPCFRRTWLLGGDVRPSKQPNTSPTHAVQSVAPAGQLGSPSAEPDGDYKDGSLWGLSCCSGYNARFPFLFLRSVSAPRLGLQPCEWGYSFDRRRTGTRSGLTARSVRAARQCGLNRGNNVGQSTYASQALVVRTANHTRSLQPWTRQRCAWPP